MPDDGSPSNYSAPQGTLFVRLTRGRQSLSDAVGQPSGMVAVRSMVIHRFFLFGFGFWSFGFSFFILSTSSTFNGVAALM